MEAPLLHPNATSSPLHPASCFQPLLMSPFLLNNRFNPHTKQRAINVFILSVSYEIGSGKKNPKNSLLNRSKHFMKVIYFRFLLGYSFD
jgi:hypothetical protein